MMMPDDTSAAIVAQPTLLDRLAAFQFDQPGTQLTFARRLARENGWSLHHAERVIDEYKAFLFLAVTAGHVVSPSEAVDQAWHLHLTYTRSYWHDLCRDLLGQPLHHGPTRGGADEQARFVTLYEQTLDSYRRLLGREPPRDIWPPAAQRFGEDLQHVAVNTARNWIIPKPRWRSIRSALAGWTATSSRSMSMFALGLVGLPLAAAWNPLDWTGPRFIASYVVMVIVAALLAATARRVLAPAEPALDRSRVDPLHPYEVACLAEGPRRAVQAAFAAMVHGGALKLVSEDARVLGVFKRTTRTVRQGTAIPADAHPLDRALFTAASTPTGNLTPLTTAGLPVARQIDDRLGQLGLLRAGLPPGRCVLSALIMAAPLLLGLPKIAVGLSRGKPVGFLVIACIVTAIASLCFLLARPRHSPRGKAILDALKKTHAKAGHPTMPAIELTSDKVAPADLALAIGLFGAGMLATGPLSDVHAMLPRAAGGGGCASGGGGCGGSGCGGDGGGGCGGCGGCGGD
jgi:uncharacterized protein (TIGR04222 family)